MIVNDAATGLPVAIMDAAEITAARTAAASGACIRHLAPAGWTRAAIIGCGEQGRYHAALIAALHPDAELHVYDPDPARVAAMPVPVTGHPSLREAVAGADVIVSLAPIVQPPAPTLERAWLRDRFLALPADFNATLPRRRARRMPTRCWPTTSGSGATTRSRGSSVAGRCRRAPSARCSTRRPRPGGSSPAASASARSTRCSPTPS